MKLYYVMTGYRKLTFDIKNVPDVLNVCMKYGYVYRDMSTDGENMSFICTLHTASRLKDRCNCMGITVRSDEIKGMPSFIYRYRNRVGLILGVIIAVSIIVTSELFVWDIRISGNEAMTDDEVEAVLLDCGLFRGSLINDLNTDRIELDSLIRCDKLIWLSVNMKGTVAYVEVREKIIIDQEDEKKLPANIVARKSGKIIEMIAYSGLAAVKAGDEVKAGDVLISGVYGEKTPGVRVTRASGYVKARTVSSCRVEIQYKHSEKVYTGRVKRENTLIFFSKPINIFINHGNFGANCDKIDNEKVLELFGIRLPIKLITTEWHEYKTVDDVYSNEEAKIIAEEKLSMSIAVEYNDADILSKRYTVTSGDNSYILSCEIVCIEDIAKVSEFEYNNGK